jgi:hypothetical protein
LGRINGFVVFGFILGKVAAARGGDGKERSEEDMGDTVARTSGAKGLACMGEP